MDARALPPQVGPGIERPGGRSELAPGGWVVLGRYAAPQEALPEALADLRTVRGGGTPLSEDDAVALLERGGLANVRSVPSEWMAPIRFVAGQRA